MKFERPEKGQTEIEHEARALAAMFDAMPEKGGDTADGQIWIDALADVPTKFVCEAVRIMAKTYRGRGLPTPGDIRGLAATLRQRSDEKAQKQARKVGPRMGKEELRSLADEMRFVLDRPISERERLEGRLAAIDHDLENRRIYPALARRCRAEINDALEALGG